MQLYLIVMEIMQLIHNRIYVIREQRIMLDRDIAALYEVETRVFNQAVKRNFQRFPSDFMFQLTREEWDAIKLRMIPTEGDMSSQIVMTYPKKRPNVALPNAFTEQGVAMLSGILHSDKAIQMNIAIMRAFVEIRRLMVKEPNVWEQLTQLKERLGEHDIQLSQIYDAIENLMHEKAEEKRWEDRERIGFIRS